MTSMSRAGTWVGDNDGLVNLTVNGIGIAASNPDTLYLQARSLGVYKSTDGGATWSKTSSFNNDNGPGYDHLIHTGPTVHPTDASIVWVASGGRVYKTTDGGGSWQLSSSGTTVNNCNGVHGVVVDPTDADHLLAGTIVAGCDGGVFESIDGGDTWTNIAGSNMPGSGVGNDAWPIVIDPSVPTRVYCGSPHNSFYRSIDGGNSWINDPPVSGDHSTYALTVNPLATNEVFCREVGGTWQSSDYGDTWVRRTQWFNDRAFTVMRFAPSNPQIAYALVGDEIWRSSNNGNDWTQVQSLIGGPRCLEVDPADPDTIYVGTAGLGMFKSTDGGATFSEINNGLPMTAQIRGWQTFGDPLDPGGMYCVLEGNTIYHRASDEDTWSYYSVLPGGGLPVIQIERHRPNRWYWADGVLWRSLDSGKTWEAVYDNGSSTSVFDVWLDPRKCGRLVLGDRDGSRVLTSDDGGDSWTIRGQVPSFDGYLGGICGDPFDENVYLIAASPLYHSGGQNGYVWRSMDGGANWTHIRDGMFYGDWRIGHGYWRLVGGEMRQEQTCCGGYHVNLDGATFGDGVYECRIRILDSNEGQTQYWAGMLIRTASPDSQFTDSGWLVFMRRNGVIALWNVVDQTVINAAEVPIVSDTSQFVTIRLEANGNQFALYADDTLVGMYTDSNHRFDGPGYVALQTNRTQAAFDDLSITGGSSFSDSFDPATQFGAYWGRWVSADPHTPGRFAYATQWGGLWFSTDHGASWYRISTDAQGGYLHYRPLFSLLRGGNLYACSGTGYSWRIHSYRDDGLTRQAVGQPLSYSTWLLGEDPHDANRLYAALYDLGISVYEGDDIVGDLASSIPVRIDADADGDVDLSDYGKIQACLSGSGFPSTDPECTRFWMDGDDDVDVDDLAEFTDCMAGSLIAPDPACDCPTP